MPNPPYLDASVQWRINSGQLSLEEPDYRSVVEAILSAGLATEVVGLISAGKEANVYLARYNGAPLAISPTDCIGQRIAGEGLSSRTPWVGGPHTGTR